jgi:hypothetical protein
MQRLLLNTLIEDSVASGDGAITSVVRALLRSPVTDAERAGERLAVFGWPAESGDGDAVSWRYRIVGVESGAVHMSFALSLPAGPDILLSVFGLQLQIALNGVAATPDSELECFQELMQVARAA